MSAEQQEPEEVAKADTSETKKGLEAVIPEILIMQWEDYDKNPAFE